MYRYQFLPEVTMSEKFTDLTDRIKKLYEKIISKAVADSFEYMESEDVALFKETVKLMEEALDLSVEYVRQNEEHGKEIKKTVDENNRLLKRLVYGKREV